MRPDKCLCKGSEIDIRKQFKPLREPGGATKLSRCGKCRLRKKVGLYPKMSLSDTKLSANMPFVTVKIVKIEGLQKLRRNEKKLKRKAKDLNHLLSLGLKKMGS